MAYSHPLKDFELLNSVEKMRVFGEERSISIVNVWEVRRQKLYGNAIANFSLSQLFEYLLSLNYPVSNNYIAYTSA